VGFFLCIFNRQTIKKALAPEGAAFSFSSLFGKGSSPSTMHLSPCKEGSEGPRGMSLSWQRVALVFFRGKGKSTASLFFSSSEKRRRLLLTSRTPPLAERPQRTSFFFFRTIDAPCKPCANEADRDLSAALSTKRPISSVCRSRRVQEDFLFFPRSVRREETIFPPFPPPRTGLPFLGSSSLDRRERAWCLSFMRERLFSPVATVRGRESDLCDKEGRVIFFFLIVERRGVFFFPLSECNFFSPLGLGSGGPFFFFPLLPEGGHYGRSFPQDERHTGFDSHGLLDRHRKNRFFFFLQELCTRT